MKLLIQYATRQRPQRVFVTINSFVANISDKGDYRVLLTCDDDDKSMNNEIIIERLNFYKHMSVFYGKRAGKIGSINRDINKIDYDWDVVLCIQDDTVCVQKDYDKIIKNAIKKHCPDTDGALWFDDPGRSSLITVIIVGKKFYDRFGYVLNSQYHSMFAEKELMAVSKKLNRLFKINDTIIEHQHYSYNKSSVENDSLYKHNASFYKIDQNTYARRKSQGFI